MELSRLIKHPELMNKETLYDLRELLALYPYYQTARLLLLRNLYLLHDSSFDEELRKAAIYITDRRVIFEMVEAPHYQLRGNEERTEDKSAKAQQSVADRTTDLIDSFLDSIPHDEEEETASSRQPAGHRRKPTPADAAVDYVRYLLDIEEEEKENNDAGNDETANEENESEGSNASRTISLIDNFIDDGGFKLKPVDNNAPYEPEFAPKLPAQEGDTDSKEAQGESGGVFTETLARIYIKQGKYQRALDIMQRLEQTPAKKNGAYLADQMRFLEKLIANSKMGSGKVDK